MNIKAVFCLFALVNLFYFPASAQVKRGAGNVSVKDSKGKLKEIKLYSDSFALVIGNGVYANGWDSLAGVASDVAAVERVLTNHGFTVETAENLTSKEFTARIQQFISDYGFEPENRLLIYYAGHGHTLKSAGDGREVGYIVPVDAPAPKDELGFRRKAVSMDTIQNYAKEIQAKHAIFFFDSCFSGKLVTRNSIVVPPIIQENVAFPVRQFVTAGAANQEVPDESIFRRSFVRGLEGEADRNNDKYITGTEFAEYLKEKVTNYSNRRQTPQYGKINDIELDRGDFIFVIPSDKKDFTVAITPKPALQSIKPASAVNWANFRPIARNLLKYENVSSFSEGLAKVIIKGKYGFIDKTGREAIVVKYDDANHFSDDLALVAIGERKKYGFIDKTGREVVPLKYDYGRDFFNGFAEVRLGDWLNGLWGIVDKTGREIIPPKYDRLEGVTESSVLALRSDGQGPYQGWVCVEFDTKTEIDFSKCYNRGSEPPFFKGFKEIKAGDKYGFQDESGQVIVSPKYDYIYFLTENSAMFKIDEKFGLIDRAGREIIAAKYDSFETLDELLVMVKMGGSFRAHTCYATEKGTKIGLIDKNGQEIITPIYSCILPLFTDLLAVSVGWNESISDNTAKWGVIDKKGRVIIPPKYDDVRGFENLILDNKSTHFPSDLGWLNNSKIKGFSGEGFAGDFIMVSNKDTSYENKVGFFNKTGREITKIKYEKIWCYAFVKDGFIGVTLNGKKGFVDLNGKEYFDF